MQSPTDFLINSFITNQRLILISQTLETIATEIEQKGFARITVERPMSEVARATALFTIQARVVARVVVVVVGELCCATRGTVCLSVSLNSLYSPASSC